MSGLPQIPASVMTIEQLDAWIDAFASTCDRPSNKGGRFANRLRMLVAVMDRAHEIGARQRAAKARAS
jgi:hypothetical protein